MAITYYLKHGNTYIQHSRVIPGSSLSPVAMVLLISQINRFTTEEFLLFCLFVFTK